MHNLLDITTTTPRTQRVYGKVTSPFSSTNLKAIMTKVFFLVVLAIVAFAQAMSVCDSQHSGFLVQNTASHTFH